MSAPPASTPQGWSGGEVATVIAVVSLVGVLTAATYLRKKDQEQLDALVRRLLADGTLRYITTRRGNKLAVRWSPSQSTPARRTFPICIPNGLGATLLTIGTLHDGLVAEGFSVLSYDRVGVGFSSAAAGAPSVAETLDDMFDVMNAILPRQRWHLLGPSMGSIVAQAFLAAHPDCVAGFFNMDGLAHPFYHARASFNRAAIAYLIAAKLVYVGLVRAGLSCAGAFFAKVASPLFPVAILVAQMNSASFYLSLRREIPLMMDLAEHVASEWGSCSTDQLPEKVTQALTRLRPTENAEFVAGRWHTLPRGPHERGADWCTEQEESEARRELEVRLPFSTLGQLFVSSVTAVRVMSARDYNYVGGNSFYTDALKDLAAAEHSLHFLMGVLPSPMGKGSSASTPRSARYVLPKIGHGHVFQQKDLIVRCCVELDDASSSDPSRVAGSAS